VLEVDPSTTWPLSASSILLSVSGAPSAEKQKSSAINKVRRTLFVHRYGLLFSYNARFDYWFYRSDLTQLLCLIDLSVVVILIAQPLSLASTPAKKMMAIPMVLTMNFLLSSIQRKNKKEQGE